MNELIQLAITALVGAVAGALTPILIARFSKTKRERDTGIVGEYLKLVDMTQDQLEKKINEAGQLGARVGELERKLLLQEIENEELKARRDERDEKIEALEARAAALEKQIEKDVRETSKLTHKYENLKGFTESLIKALKKKGIELPEELQAGIPDSIKGWKWEERK